MSTSSLRLCVWRCRATELGYSPRWTMGAASSWEKCRTRRRRIVWARRGKVVIVIVTWAVPFLPLSLPFCTSIALFFAITPSRSLSFSLFLSLSRSSATCHKMVAWERCLLILGLGLFFFFYCCSAAAACCVLPLDLLPFETHLAALAHPLSVLPATI